MGRPRKSRTARAFLETKSPIKIKFGYTPFGKNISTARPDGIKIYTRSIPELEASLQYCIENGHEPGETLIKYRDTVRGVSQDRHSTKNSRHALPMALALLASMGSIT